MVQALKDIEGLCSKEKYNGLCYLLTIERIEDHPDFATWSIPKGRLECFEKVKTCLSSIY
jgi:hypothetical protein